jgi:hypothetical protein
MTSSPLVGSGKGARKVAEDVEELLAALEHPRKPEILALRRIILDADPRVEEIVKWKAPTFRTTQDFATFHLQAKEGVQLILHLGARTPEGATARGAVNDPENLLEWLGDDRATVRFRDLADVEAKREAFAAVIREWIERLPG